MTATRRCPGPAGARARARAELTREIKDDGPRASSPTDGAAGLLAARRGPRARHGVVGGLPLLPEPRRPAHRAHHRRLRRPRRRGRGRARRPCAAPTCAGAGSPIAPRRARLGARAPARVRAHLRLAGARLRRPASTPSAPASRVTRLLVALLVESARGRASRAGHAYAARGARRPRPGARVHREGLPPDLELDVPPDDLIVRGLMAWTYLFGAISFELFGHRAQRHRRRRRVLHPRDRPHRRARRAHVTSPTNARRN